MKLSTTFKSLAVLGFVSTSVMANDQMGTKSDFKFDVGHQFHDVYKAIGADKAWERGWTGKGESIMVIDTGVNYRHDMLEGKVIEGGQIGRRVKEGLKRVRDTHRGRHGTGVASVAAGSVNNKWDIQGIAFEADLIIAKAGRRGVSLGNFAKSLKWANTLDHDISAINLSSNYYYDRSSIRGISKLSDGTFKHTAHRRWKEGKYYLNSNPASIFNEMNKMESVLVVSAGNQGLAYSASPAVFAAAENADGSLMSGGKMIIAGAYDVNKKDIHNWSNKAGHLCIKVTASGCGDKYRTGQFFLMAPGWTYGANGKKNGDQYKVLGGTSYAAPQISGAVAIISQMWPHMKGEAITQLLFQTANKDIPNYDIDRHGQGLLDLDKATQPVFADNIPKIGRGDGTKVNLTGSFSLGGFANSGFGLSSVAIVDEYNRDYSIDLTPMAMTGVDMQPIYTTNHKKGQSWASKFTGGQEVHDTQSGISMSFGESYVDPLLPNQEVKRGMSMSIDSTAFHTKGEDYVPPSNILKMTISTGISNPWMYFDGMFGTMEGNTTTEVAYIRDFKNGAYFQSGIMNTSTDFQKGLVTDVSDIQAYYAVAGYQSEGFNFNVGMKPKIVGGTVSLTLPDHIDADGNLHHKDYTASLRNATTGFTSIGYSKSFGDHSLGFDSTVDSNRGHNSQLSYKFNW